MLIMGVLLIKDFVMNALLAIKSLYSVALVVIIKNGIAEWKIKEFTLGAQR